VNANNEPTDIVEHEDVGLDHEDLDLSKEEYRKLKYKFKEFNAAVDMEAPMFKVGMLSSSMEEFRRALFVCIVNEMKIKINKQNKPKVYMLYVKVFIISSTINLKINK
jgi:hypothetical protein